MSRYFTPENFEEERLRGIKLEEKTSSDNTPYSSIEFVYNYPCEICSKEDDNETCTICGKPCPNCSPLTDECPSCKESPDNDCSYCKEVWADCKKCQKGKTVNNSLGTPILRLMDLTSEYGISFPPGPKMYGKMSVGININYNDELHVKYFGDSNYTPGQPDGIIKRIRLRVIGIFKQLGGAKYPKYAGKKMDENELCRATNLFAAHIKVPPTEEEISEDTTGNLVKKSKKFAKYFKGKYHQSKFFLEKKEDAMSEDDKNTVAVMRRQKDYGLGRGETPVGVYSFTKFFYAVKNRKDEVEIKQVRNLNDLSGKTITGCFYINYDSLYIGNTTALVENLNQVFINSISDVKSNSFIDNKTIVEQIMLNKNQSEKVMQVAEWFEKETKSEDVSKIEKSSDGFLFDDVT